MKLKCNENYQQNMEKTIKIQIPEGYNDAVFDKETNEIKFIKKDGKPRNWKEYCEKVKETSSYCAYLDSSDAWVGERNRKNAPYVCEFNTEEEAKAVIALCKLIQLRDAWWGDWKPDWDSPNCKFIIHSESNKIHKFTSCYCNCCLAFPTEEMRDDFLETFRDLIEEAKPLL